MVATGGSSWHQSNRGVSLYFASYLLLFVAVLSLSRLLHASKLASFVPEAALTILIGIISGAIFSLANGSDSNNVASDVTESILSFSPTIFFVILLPPIIFNSGYHVQRQLFFQNIGIISLYAIIGTILASLLLAYFLFSVRSLFGGFQPSFLELLAFGSLISATDPVSTLAVFQAKHVDPRLFYLVFGESVLNDAVGLVLFESLAHLLEMESSGSSLSLGQEIAQFFFDFVVGFLGSMILGIVMGLAYAKAFKHAHFDHTPLLETCLYLTIVYVPFCLAELAHLSGIVTVLFAGIAARRYVVPNLGDETAQTADVVIRLVSHITETIIFLELGLNVCTVFTRQTWNPSFLGFSLLGCLLSRAGNIYPLTAIFNMSPSSEPVPWKTTHMVWFSGLRGAVSYALSKNFPGDSMGTIVATTTVIVLVTTFLLGGTTEAALTYLDIPMNVDEKEYLANLEQKSLLPASLLKFEASIFRRCTVQATKGDEPVEVLGVDGCYQAHDVEYTVEDHLERVRQHVSVYDFGNHIGGSNAVEKGPYLTSK